MKATINGKRYDSDRCEALAEYDHRNHSNNYTGTSTLYLAPNGKYLHGLWSNGQDCYPATSLSICEDTNEFLEGCNLTDEQEARLVELGLIEIV